MDAAENSFLKDQGLEIRGEIGKGGYGLVYSVYSHVYKTIFALKKIPLDRFKDCEIECFKQIDDKHIVSLYRFFTCGNSAYLLMEYCPKDLCQLVDEQLYCILSEERARIIYDMILGVKACHDRNIAHCDIKPQNFIVDQYGRIKITDFGLSSLGTDEEEGEDHLFKGTKHYMAPEIYKKEYYDKYLADIWALGVSIYPFNADDTPTLVERMNRGLFPVDKINDPLLIKLIAKCLQPNPVNRPNATELLQMPYFLQFARTHVQNNVVHFKKAADAIVKPMIPKVRSYMNMGGKFTYCKSPVPRLIVSNI